MPCVNATHSHEWAATGTLSIAKCESRCGFCSSTKEYKPASALRKHVATHIKNDKMSLTLAQSTGGRPRLQAVLDLHDVSKLPSNTEASAESRLSPRPKLPNLPTCWRCTILDLECDGISPCNACIGLDPPRSCGYESLAEHTSLIFAWKLNCWEDESNFLETLHWRGPGNRSIHITFIDNELMDSEQTGQYQITSRRRSIGDEVAITHLLCSQMDPAVMDPLIVVKAANYLVHLIPSLTLNSSKTQSPGAFSGLNSTLQALLLLENCRILLDATDRIFAAALSNESQIKNNDVIRGLVSGDTFNIKRMLKRFLGGLFDITVNKTAKSRLEYVLEAFYGILLLFMVRSTLRSILRYSRFGFTSFGHQANQDHSFERGVACALYQPMLAVLESSKLTFGAMLWSLDSDGIQRPGAVYHAAEVIHIPDPLNATPLEHILFFFKQAFPARVASTERSVESAAKKPSKHLAAADPSTYMDPSTYLHLPG